MEIKISTFHNIRNFKPYMIPISTAMWDPKWYHDNQGPSHVFKDKRGVWNGFKYHSLAPGITCENLCRGPETCGSTPDCCPFLQNYGKQLNNIDFDVMIRELEHLAQLVKKKEGFKEDPVIVLLVYEKPDNPCSERWELKKWFTSHGYELEEEL